MSTAAGRVLENRLLPKLKGIWPSIALSSKNTQSNDFTGPFPIEAKRRAKWDIQQWVRNVRAVSSTNKWAIFVSPKNIRTDEVGPIMIVDESFGIELLALWDESQAPAWKTDPALRSRVDL